MSNTLSTQKILLLIGLSIMGVVINIDYTAVNLALVTIAKQMHTSLDVIQWILSGYLLAWAAIVIPAGKAADIFGQRRVCTIGLTLFMISSVLAGLSTSAWMIITSRILQGMSGAIFVPTLYSLIYSQIPENKRGMAIGVFSLGVGVGAAIGPTFGGFFLKTLGWSWIFYINVPVILVAMALILSSTEKDSIDKSKSHALQPGALFLGASIVIFMYAINQLNHYALFSPTMLALFAACAALFAIFIMKEKTTSNRIIPKSLLSNKRYRGITIAFSIEQFCFSSSFVVLGLYMQNTLHFSAFYASIIFLALSGIFAVVSSVGGMIVDKVGVNRPALIGFLLMAIGSYWFLLLPSQTNIAQLIGVLLVLGTGMGFAFSALNAGMVKTVQAEEVGIASSVFILFALVGNALGVVISTLIMLSHGISTSITLTAIMTLVGAGVVGMMMRLPAKAAA